MRIYSVKRLRRPIPRPGLSRFPFLTAAEWRKYTLEKWRRKKFRRRRQAAEWSRSFSGKNSAGPFSSHREMGGGAFLYGPLSLSRICSACERGGGGGRLSWDRDWKCDCRGGDQRNVVHHFFLIIQSSRSEISNQKGRTRRINCRSHCAYCTCTTLHIEKIPRYLFEDVFRH